MRGRLWVPSCVLLAWLASVTAHVDVAFEFVQKDTDTVTAEQLMAAIRSLQLPALSAAPTRLVALNATLIRGQCDAGWDWEDPHCLACACATPLASAATSVWFEPL